MGLPDLAGLTLGALVVDLCNQNAFTWLADWWFTNPSTVILQAGGKTWDAKRVDVPCPPGLVSLGWNGSSQDRLHWVGFDLDVGHGTASYPDRDAAIKDARRLRDFFHGQAEVRLSKSGEGVHVRHKIPMDAHRSPADGSRLAKRIAASLGLRADSSPSGRQAFWFWIREPLADSFKLIENHGEMKA